MTRRFSLALLLLLAPLCATADVRLVQPANRATLNGGSTAMIQWSATDLPADLDIEEWEAFLSVDGGRYYGARITPHLDISVHQFQWLVPNVASSNARILIRFGNERNETAIELPLSLSIEPIPRVLTPMGIVSTFGEPARPGDRGVALWADSNGNLATSIPTFETQFTFFVKAIPVFETADDVAPILALQEQGSLAERRNVIRANYAPSTPDVLLQSRRLNI